MMKFDSDEVIWGANDQVEAFGVLFDRHAKSIYNHCFRRTANWSLAEELTSIVFMEA